MANTKKVVKKGKKVVKKVTLKEKFNKWLQAQIMEDMEFLAGVHKAVDLFFALVLKLTHLVLVLITKVLMLTSKLTTVLLTVLLVKVLRG
jgi:hypothetical protein